MFVICAVMCTTRKTGTAAAGYIRALRLKPSLMTGSARLAALVKRAFHRNPDCLAETNTGLNKNNICTEPKGFRTNVAIKPVGCPGIQPLCSCQSVLNCLSSLATGVAPPATVNTEICSLAIETLDMVVPLAMPSIFQFAICLSRASWV